MSVAPASTGETKETKTDPDPLYDLIIEESLAKNIYPIQSYICRRRLLRIRSFRRNDAENELLENLERLRMTVLRI